MEPKMPIGGYGSESKPAVPTAKKAMLKRKLAQAAPAKAPKDGSAGTESGGLKTSLPKPPPGLSGPPMFVQARHSMDPYAASGGKNLLQKVGGEEGRTSNRTSFASRKQLSVQGRGDKRPALGSAIAKAATLGYGKKGVSDAIAKAAKGAGDAAKSQSRGLGAAAGYAASGAKALAESAKKGFQSTYK